MSRRQTISLQITKRGGIQMLHDDEFDMRRFGKPEIVRASHVEYENLTGRWYVYSVRWKILSPGGFPTRAQALAWEKSYFSPGGKGWASLKRRRSSV